jgi:hypothetical protein
MNVLCQPSALIPSPGLSHCRWQLAASQTMGTARPITSGEYFGCVFMTPFSQTMKPQQNPGRFIVCGSISLTLLRNPVPLIAGIR